MQRIAAHTARVNAVNSAVSLPYGVYPCGRQADKMLISAQMVRKIYNSAYQENNMHDIPKTASRIKYN